MCCSLTVRHRLNTQTHSYSLYEWGRSKDLCCFSIGLNVMLFSVVNYDFLLGVCNDAQLVVQ